MINIVTYFMHFQPFEVKKVSNLGQIKTERSDFKKNYTTKKF